VRLPRVRMSLRGMMVAVAIVPALLMAARFVVGCWGRGTGSTMGRTGIWAAIGDGMNFEAVTYVKDWMIFAD
jgi:hypothetical protein